MHTHNGNKVHKKKAITAHGAADGAKHKVTISKTWNSTGTTNFDEEAAR